jgi:hypothetical protein
LQPKNDLPGRKGQHEKKENKFLFSAGDRHGINTQSLNKKEKKKAVQSFKKMIGAPVIHFSMCGGVWWTSFGGSSRLINLCTWKTRNLSSPSTKMIPILMAVSFFSTCKKNKKILGGEP